MQAGLLLQSFIRDENGATTMEYALIAVIASIAVTSGVIAISQGLTDIFTDVRNAFDANQAPN